VLRKALEIHEIFGVSRNRDALSPPQAEVMQRRPDSA